MREQVIALLGQLLQNNIGQRLTDELATGIATSLNHQWRTAEASVQETAEADPQATA